MIVILINFNNVSVYISFIDECCRFCDVIGGYFISDYY